MGVSGGRTEPTMTPRRLPVCHLEGKLVGVIVFRKLLFLQVVALDLHSIIRQLQSDSVTVSL